MVHIRLTAGAVLASFVLVACGSEEDASPLPQSSETVELDPADFTTEIDNPWWPMKPVSVSGGSDREELVS